MYELKPEDAKDLARLFGEEDHEQEIEELKKEQQKLKNELLREKLQQERQKNKPPERENATKKRPSELIYIITLLAMFCSVIISFIFLIYLIKKY